MNAALLCFALFGQVQSAPPAPVATESLLTIDTAQAASASATAGQRWSTWVANLPRTDARGRSGNGCNVGSNGCNTGSNGCSTGGCGTSRRILRLRRR